MSTAYIKDFQRTKQISLNQDIRHHCVVIITQRTTDLFQMQNTKFIIITYFLLCINSIRKFTWASDFRGLLSFFMFLF